MLDDARPPGPREQQPSMDQSETVNPTLPKRLDSPTDSASRVAHTEPHLRPAYAHILNERGPADAKGLFARTRQETTTTVPLTHEAHLKNH